MRRLGDMGVFTLSAALAFASLGCDPGGVTGPGGFCDPDVLAPSGTSGALRQYEKDLINCTRRNPPYARGEVRGSGPPARADRAE